MMRDKLRHHSAMAAFVITVAYVLGRGVHGGNSPATIALRSRSTI
jgi:hypothetical protein